jgi:hypothetical protein
MRERKKEKSRSKWKIKNRNKRISENKRILNPFNINHISINRLKTTIL